MHQHQSSHACLIVLVHHFSPVTTLCDCPVSSTCTRLSKFHWQRIMGRSLFVASAQSFRPFTALTIIGNQQQQQHHPPHQPRTQTSMSQHCCLTTPCISWSPYTCSAVTALDVIAMHATNKGTGTNQQRGTDSCRRQPFGAPRTRARARAVPHTRLLSRLLWALPPQQQQQQQQQR